MPVVRALSTHVSMRALQLDTLSEALGFVADR